MKLFIGITLIFCVCSSCLKGQPKPLPDSIRLEYPEHHALITFELRRFEENKSIIRNFPQQLSELLDHIKSSITVNDQGKPHHVYVVSSEGEAGQYLFQLRTLDDNETKVRVSDKTIVELLPPGWDVHIKMKDAEIQVYAPDLNKLEQLSELNMENVITHLDKDPEVHRQHRFGLISRVVVSDAKVQNAKTSHRLPNDMVGLHAGAGLGLVNERLYPEFNFALSFYLANRYKENHQRISAHYELKLFTGRSSEGDYISQPASFLSVSYALNFRQDRPRWTGIGAGFLVHNRVDMFKGNTMKLFIESDIGSSKLNLIPELYLTDDYKKAVFGLKLNYKF